MAYAAGLEVDQRRRVWIFRSLDLDRRMIESYRSRLRCHVLPRFGELSLGAITALGVTEWTRELERAGFAPSTVSSQLNLLSMLLTDAADERLIPFNPVRRRRRRGRRSWRAVAERIWATPEQVVRIAEQAGVLGGPIARLLVITAAWTGCRWGELAGLHRDNVDLRRGVIMIDPLVGALIAQARRLGHHLDNRVIETYSHVAPEVEQRLLDDLEHRWHKAAPPPPHRHRVWSTVGGWRRLSPSSPRWGHPPDGPANSRNTAPTPYRGWGRAPVLPQQEQKITAQARHC
ncbi:hypothetical protein PV458_05280 [Streptomyces sp. MN03-5084-2B]|nr:hypothetical protein [Streptomyces sp. MN03-5084-2B]